jgi:hypothetical protein
LDRPGLPIAPKDGLFGVVALLGGAKERPDPAVLSRLRDRFRAAALCLVDIEPASRGAWADAILRELSHNEPVDRALFNLFRASVSSQDRRVRQPPLLVAASGFLERALLAREIERIIERIRALPPSAPLRLTDLLAHWLGLDTGKVSRAKLARRLKERARYFGREEEGGTEAAHAAKTAERAPAPPEALFPDVCLYRDDDGARGERIESGSRLDAGSYWLGFTYTPGGKRSGLPIEGDAQPLGPLAEDQPALLVTVAARLPSHVKFTETTRLLKLRRDKASETVWFKFELAPPPSGPCEIEVRVHYRLNLVDFLVVRLKVDDHWPRSGIVQETRHREPARARDALYAARARHIHVGRAGTDYRITITAERTDGKKVKAAAETQIIGTGELEAILQKVRDFWLTCCLDWFGASLAPPDMGLRDKAARKAVELGGDLWTQVFRGGWRNGALAALESFVRDAAPPPGALVQVTLERNARDFVFPWASCATSRRRRTMSARCGACAT